MPVWGIEWRKMIRTCLPTKLSELMIYPRNISEWTENEFQCE